MTSTRRCACVLANVLTAVGCAPAGPLPPGPLPLPAITQYDTRGLMRLHFTGPALNALTAFWLQAQHERRENAACLQGRLVWDTIFVDTLAQAEVLAREPHRVTLPHAANRRQGCAETGFLGGAHTHLLTEQTQFQPLCHSSSEDYLTFWSDPRAVVMVVACAALADGKAAEVTLFWVVRDGRFGQATFYGERTPPTP